MTTTTPTESNTIVHETLIDLASSADRQAARAAHFDHVVASATLFALADDLRSMAQKVLDGAPEATAFDLLDKGRAHIATTALQFDRLSLVAGERL